MQYEKSYQVRWADLDPNMHMKSVAFLEYATHTRFAFLHDEGIDLAFMRAHSIGPILFEEKINFFRECGPQQLFTVNNIIVAMAEGARKWHFKHEFKATDGTLCAVVSAQGAWLNLAERKVVAPPVEVHTAFLKLPQEAVNK